MCLCGCMVSLMRACCFCGGQFHVPCQFDLDSLMVVYTTCEFDVTDYWFLGCYFAQSPCDTRCQSHRTFSLQLFAQPSYIDYQNIYSIYFTSFFCTNPDQSRETKTRSTGLYNRTQARSHLSCLCNVIVKTDYHIWHESKVCCIHLMLFCR